MTIKEVCNLYEEGKSIESIATKYAKVSGISFLDAMESVMVILKRAWR